MAFHSAGISECMTAGVFLDALRKYEEVLSKVSLIQEQREPLRFERRVSFTTVNRRFPDATFARVDAWVRDGVLSKVMNGNGKPTYRLSEVERQVQALT